MTAFRNGEPELLRKITLSSVNLPSVLFDDPRPLEHYVDPGLEP
jgi:hypothetical protein